MLPDYLQNIIREDDNKFIGHDSSDYALPIYSPTGHYLDLTKSKYYYALLLLRNSISATCDYYFGIKHKAKKVDLFMITPSISSPTGPGSNSEAMPIKFGSLNSYLVDSAQFGFEPLLLNKFSKVYCYLPSMRGEDCDCRHLNQFYHCEAEIKGTLDDVYSVVEDMVRTLCHTLRSMPNIINLISANPKETLHRLEQTAQMSSFPKITFDDAVNTLRANGREDCIVVSKTGRDITARGENELARLFNLPTPFWLTGFDRDRVPFYQKPDANNPDKVINADMLFPQITAESFGGEVVGCGQRQDRPDEMLDSLKRQGLSAEPYEWYIDLRKQPGYETTSGFGIGIERFLAWALCRSDIKDVIIYPRLKNILTYP